MSMRIAADAFTSLPLRCHALLSDVPLHDVWAIALEGGGPGRTVADVNRIVFDPQRPASNVAVRALFALRWWLGRLFGWDEERYDVPDQSYANRLTSADRVVYMAMIDPFRHRVVYPALGRHAQREWLRRYQPQNSGSGVNAATDRDP